ncbi:hypothetical protein BTM25_12290 [Actinomadura rubteroloni]|uniref:PH domain-containing protein n=1 Tax=Actinomadura rubteroloni TaxID=1926885 RepID=A0A2P4UP44_9ACTN|nr:hypothetical protein [Actinomadura rubteroloni]POM26821.1 hypothetical protein BTM25_12290 [Actinomadura rubteroloni]
MPERPDEMDRTGVTKSGLVIIRSNWLIAYGGFFVVFGLMLGYIGISYAARDFRSGDPVEVIHGLLTGNCIAVNVIGFGVLPMRSAIVLSDQGLLLRRSLSDLWIPWPAIRAVDAVGARLVITVTCDDSRGESREVDSSLFTGSGDGDVRRRHRAVTKINHFRASRSPHASPGPYADAPRRRWSAVSLGLVGFMVTWTASACIFIIGLKWS